MLAKSSRQKNKSLTNPNDQKEINKKITAPKNQKRFAIKDLNFLKNVLSGIILSKYRQYRTQNSRRDSAF